MLDYFDYLYVKIPLYGHLLRGIRYFIRIFANLYARYLMVGENINNTITISIIIYWDTSNDINYKLNNSYHKYKIFRKTAQQNRRQPLSGGKCPIVADDSTFPVGKSLSSPTTMCFR